MMFRRTLFSALFVGMITGLLLSLSQMLIVNPIIFEAETYEVVEVHKHDDYGAQTHDHNEESWSPEDGLERTLFTVLANSFVGIGFAAILIPLMSQSRTQLQIVRNVQIDFPKGALWGIVGFTVFFIAPAIGLPPEIPGIEAAPVKHRQLWWLLSVVCVGLGIAVIYFASLKIKALGFLAISIPYLVEIPHNGGVVFSHSDPSVVIRLTELHHEFLIASSVSNLIFWIVLGIMSSWALNRWILPDNKEYRSRVSLKGKKNIRKKFGGFHG